MGQLLGNDAVRLGSLHRALHRALKTLPSLQPSVVLDVSVIRSTVRTRGECAAAQQRRQRSDSFGAFRAAHPGVAMDAVTVRMALPAVLPRLVDRDAMFDMYWLPLRALKRLYVETSTLASGLAQVNAPPCAACMLCI